MNKQLFFLYPILLAFACSQPGKHQGPVENIPDSSVIRTDSTSGKSSSWSDSLITKYIRETDNPLIKSARQDTTPIEWMFDDTRKTDTAYYLIYHIGHDAEDSGGVDKRFVTDGWICIDTAKRRLYEYFTETDSLAEWKEK